MVATTPLQGEMFGIRRRRERVRRSAVCDMHASRLRLLNQRATGRDRQLE
jgi:hypothetical protein